MSKRKCLEDSSEMVATGEKVGDMAVKDLLELMQGSIAKTLDEKLKTLPTKEDFDKINTKIEDVSDKFNNLSAENEILKEKVKTLEEFKELTERRLIHLEDSVKRKNIIIRGIEAQQSVYKAVQKLFKDTMKIKPAVEIVTVKKIFEKENKMVVKVELRTEKMVSDVLKFTKNLRGTTIFIEIDLNCDRLQRKKIMLQLKNDILEVNKTKKILVRNDKIRVGDEWLRWDNKQVLVGDKESAETILTATYGEEASKIDISYDSLLTKINTKNLNVLI